MYNIPNKVDFYITNVCNLTCQNCNRFNNLNFKGWQRWADYESTYEQWGQLVELKAITIMGGEPFLNPTLPEWIAGLNRIFGIEVQVLTNGTRLLQAPGVYDAISKFRRSKNNRAPNHIGVSLHNLNDFDRLRSDIHEFLQGQITEEFGKENNQWNADWHFRDRYGIQINVYRVDHFSQASIIPLGNGTYTLHNNNPVESHAECSFARWKSYHFIRGQLFKCGPSALMPEFDLQTPFDISPEDRLLLHSYRPLSTDNFAEYHNEFFANLDNPIAQCKFCPKLGPMEKIYPVRKGSGTN
jgi:organic radical activating enzyme